VTRYGLVFLSVALTVLAIALLLDGAARGLLIWTSLGLGLIAAAYLLERPELFGKHHTGRLAPWAVIVALPVVLLNYAFWVVKTRVQNEAASHEIAPGIFVGRLPLPGELPPGTMTIVDVTSELIAHPQIRIHPGYRVYPMLDDGFVEPEVLEQIVAELLELPGPVLIHCAAGHGRSAALAAALGIARGHFDDPDDAEAKIRDVRPRVRFTRQQRERLHAWHRSRER
jgi:hypothetical protein